MRLLLLPLLLCVPLSLHFIPHCRADGPAPVATAASKFKAPPGFNVTLFAGEPDVVQPIAFTFDDRGRMWVVECVMYPKWSQDGKGGRDRVVILEDTDGDGVHDKKTVVLDNGVNLSGIELGFGGMYLCSSPNLIFIPIQDDKPSGKPEVLLDGWNIKDAKHNVFNSLGWGPDGWLYGCNGIQTKSHVGKPGTADKDRIFFDCGVWRWHPTRKVFEVVATGTTNPWGLDWDEMGEMFITNCVIDHLWHVIPGGRYTRMYGEDYNPHTYGYMGSAVDYKHWAGGPWTESRFDKATGTAKKEHGDAGGGHAHSGAAIYLGENFPKEYRNTLFTCNIHGNRLNNDGLERTPTGMKGVRRPDFLFANDPWFRGICVKQGPDGGLYVSDWSDTGECHNYEVADISNGRIYRTVYGAPKKFEGDVSKYTDAELVKAAISKNEWLSRKARRVLQERSLIRIPKELAEGLRKQLSEAKDSATRLRCAWALNAIRDTFYLPIDLTPEDPAYQRWLYRLYSDGKPETERGRYGASELAYLNFRNTTQDKSIPTLRVQATILRRAVLASRAKESPEAVQEWADELFSSGLLTHDVDPDTALMFWYAVDAADLDMPRLIKTKAKQPLLFDFLTRKLLAIADKPLSAANEVLKELPGMPSDECRTAAVRGLVESLRGVKAVPSKVWQATYAHYLDTKSADLRKQLDELGLMFGDETVVAFLKKRITTVSEKPADRNRAIELLSARKMPEIVESLRAGLRDPQVRGAAIRGLANYPEESTAQAILAVYPQLTAEEKTDAIQTLASRKSFAVALLSAIEKGTVPKTEITAFSARQIIALKDKSIDATLAKVWGTIRPASATRVAQTEKLKSLLTATTLQKADKAHGRELFAKNCAACHKLFGEGGEVGPELTGSQRASLDYVLENVLDPSAIVANEYKLITFNLIDGRVVSGIVRKTTGQALTIRTLNDELTVLVEDIESQKPTGLSIMPDGLFDNLKDDEIRDLVAYLGSPQQVPLK